MGFQKGFACQHFTVRKGETRCLIDVRLVLADAQAVRVINMLTCSSKTCFVDQRVNPSISWALPHLEHLSFSGHLEGLPGTEGILEGHPGTRGIPNRYFLVNHQIRV
jgi:hypothetical protein